MREFKVGDIVEYQEILRYPEAKIVAIEEDDGVPFYTLEITEQCYDQQLMEKL